MATAISPQSPKVIKQTQLHPESPGSTSARNHQKGQFEKLLQEQEFLMTEEEKREQLLEYIKDSVSIKIKEKALDCPSLDNNKIYSKLKSRVKQFFLVAELYNKQGPTKQQLEQEELTGVHFTYRIQLHKSLYRLLREIQTAPDQETKVFNLKRIFKWYFEKLEACGMLSKYDQIEKDSVLSTGKLIASKISQKFINKGKKMQLMDEAYQKKVAAKRFENGERTLIRDLPPAEDRISVYQRKGFGKKYQQVMDHHSERPQSQGLTQFSQGQHDVTTQASLFEEEEKSVYKHPFNSFYTSGDPVLFNKVNTFTGRSNYLCYFPSDNGTEQRLENLWFKEQNKLIAEKRRDEENQLIFREFSDNKSRLEEEVMRKQEHRMRGSNFEQVRGYVASRNGQRVKYDPNYNPLLEDTTPSASDNEEQPPEQNKSTEKPGYQSIFGGTKKNLFQEESDLNEEKDHVDQEIAESYSNIPLKQHATSFMNQRKQQQSVTKIINLIQEPNYGLRPSTTDVIQQLETVAQYNNSLPTYKQNKALPMMSTTNVGTVKIIRKVGKERNISQLYTKFTPIGIVEDAYNFKKVDKEGSEAMTMGEQVRSVSESSAKKKISYLRRYQGSLINGENNRMDDQTLDNVFVNTSDMRNEYSMSLYNNKQSFQKRNLDRSMSSWLTSYQERVSKSAIKRPMTKKLNRDGVIMADEGFDKELPEFQVPSDLHPIVRGNLNQLRQEQMEEIEGIKEKMNHDNCPQNGRMLERAIMYPEYEESMPGEKKYPGPKAFLMEDPFPPVKKKGKKKKGKKR